MPIRIYEAHTKPRIRENSSSLAPLRLRVGVSFSFAFTLVEMLAVVAIVVVLAAFLVPGVKVVRDAADKAHCISNLRQIGAGLAAYLSENNGVYPEYRSQRLNPETGQLEWAGERRWHNDLINGGYAHPKSFLCKGSRGTKSVESAILWGGISYGINIELTFDQPRSNGFRPARAGDVTAHTIVAGDAATSTKGDTTGWYGESYMYPEAYSGSEGGGVAWPRHNGVCNILWGDGHVSGVRAPDPKNWKSLYSPEALGKSSSQPKNWLRRSFLPDS